MDTLTREPVTIQTRKRSRSWLVAVLCLLVIAAIGAAIWFWPAGSADKAARSRNANQPIPILEAPVVHQDVPIYLDALGTVQASQTVTIKPMVDGPLVSVNFNEGQNVRKGEVLAQIDPRPYQAALDGAVAKKAQDEAQLANAKLDYARYQKLVASNYTSAQQADTAKAQVAQFTALVQQDQAQIDTARTNLSYTTITAPMDARAGLRQVDAGNIVHASDAAGLVVLTQLHPISVLFTLPQQSLPAVAAALREGSAQVAVYAQAASGTVGKPLDTGVLTVLDNQVDQTTGTIKLKGSLPNPDNVLWPGEFVRVRLRVATERNAVVVPPAAVQRGPQGPYVYIVAGGAAAKRQPVEVGYQDEQITIVTGGLSGGEHVVVDGASRLSDGSKVSVVQPAAEGRGANPDAVTAPGTRIRRAGGEG
jgi:membrane fusion protein, multidrug efflux system